MHSFDTSALIDGMFRLYRPKNFPSLWHKIDDLIQAERIIATEEVYHEIERKEDRLVDWCKARKKMFVQIDDAIQPVVTQILTDHRNLIKEMGQRSAGDPFVIALAVIRNGVVVTAQRPSTTPLKQWFQAELSSLRANSIQREKNAKIGLAIMPYFYEHGSGWKAAAKLNTWPLVRRKRTKMKKPKNVRCIQTETLVDIICNPSKFIYGLMAIPNQNHSRPLCALHRDKSRGDGVGILGFVQQQCVYTMFLVVRVTSLP
jgi:hypothetical protein